MVNVNHHRGTPQDVHVPPRLPGAVYGAVAVTLAVFFLGLVIARPSIKGYRVSAAVDFGALKSAAIKDGVSTAMASTSVFRPSLQQIADAAHAASYRVEGAAPDGSTPPLPGRRPRQLFESVETKVTREDPEKTQVTLIYRGRDLAWSLAFVEHLAGRFAVEEPDPPVSSAALSGSIREARWHLRQARHYERKARFDMEAALNRHFERLEDAENQPEICAAVLNDSQAVGGRAPAARPVGYQNPEFGGMRDEFAQLKTALLHLLEDFSSQDPAAQRIALSIERLERQLDATPRNQDETARSGPVSSSEFIDGTGVQRRPRQVAYASPHGASPRFSGPLLEEARLYRQLQEYYERAIRRRDEAEHRLSELVLRQSSESRGRPARVARMVRPANVVGQLGGQPPADLVLAIGLLASTCGLLMYWRISTLGGLSQISSAEELQSILAVPLVGRVSIAPMSSRVRRRACWGAAVRWSTRAAECVLLAVTVCFLWSAIAASPAVAELASNPFAAIASRVADCCGI